MGPFFIELDINDGQSGAKRVAWGLLPLVWPLEGGIIPIANFLDDRGPQDSAILLVAKNGLQ